MGGAAPARRAACALVGERRRRTARMRDLLRTSPAMGALDPRDRALAFRLAMGATAAETLVDELLDERLRRPSSLEPRVRDALRVSCFEACWMDTPGPVVVSQGVELVRRVSPRAAGMANAVLRRLVHEVRPEVAAARERCAEGAATERDLVLASGLPAWLTERLVADRGERAAAVMAGTLLEPARVFVAANEARHDARETADLLREAGLASQPLMLPGCFELDSAAGLASSGLVETTDVVVADLAAQLVAHLAAPRPDARVLEVGQGRGTKSLLLESEALHAGALAQVVAIDTEPGKVRLSSRRMRAAGLEDAVTCLAFDGCALAGPDLPHELQGAFDLVFLDAPCSGSGTMRRHPEIASSLVPATVDPHEPTSLPALQRALLGAAATRVAAGGVLAYATCSALRCEDEDIVQAFLASPEGAAFELLPATARLGSFEGELARALAPWVSPEGFLLTGVSPACLGPADTHFLALLRRVV